VADIRIAKTRNEECQARVVAVEARAKEAAVRLLY
jgi:hypothetical protein